MESSTQIDKVVNHRQHGASFRLTKTKRAVLATVAEYFCLRVNDIATVMRDRDPNESDRRSVRNTAHLLYQAGFLNRLPYIELERERGPVSFVYGLSDKGVRYCKGLFDGRIKTFDEHSQRTLDHEIEISLFHLAIKRMCVQNHLSLYWQQDDLKCTINPDAMFAITDPTKPDDRNTLYYFLEIERAKLGHYVNGEPSIMRKLGKYYEYYDSPACLREWGGIQQFRVIVVQRSEQRRNNLLQELRLHFNHRMFWLTTEEQYRDDVAAPIFKTTKDGDARVYSFLDI